ncbi:radical SAM family heme chaperone HemW [Anaerosinus sp.]
MIDEGEKMQLGLYLHIPFCQQKCFYCDFPSYANKEGLQDEYITALSSEIALQGGLLSAYSINTVYIGGGTPTVLPIHLLTNLIQTIQKKFKLTNDVEFTIEVNPQTINREGLYRLYEFGVNRISFGVQSFQDPLLKRIGRIHTADEARQIVCDAASIGFKNISLDLMYGLPKQTLDEVEYSVREAIKLPIQHISVYGLKVEEGTVFAKLEEQNKLFLPDETLEDKMYEFVMKQLPAFGFERYEISNFAKAGFESRHNLKYWQCLPYIGLGAAAHSCFQNKRFYNEQQVEKYIQKIKWERNAVAHEELLSHKDKVEEFCFLGLRKKTGISCREFMDTFGYELKDLYGDTIENLKRKKLLSELNGQIFLTSLGMKYGNQVFCEFLLDS